MTVSVHDRVQTRTLSLNRRKHNTVSTLGHNGDVQTKRDKPVDDMTDPATHFQPTLTLFLNRHVANPGKTDWRLNKRFPWIVFILTFAALLSCPNSVMSKGPKQFLECDIDSHIRKTPSTHAGPAKISRLHDNSCKPRSCSQPTPVRSEHHSHLQNVNKINFLDISSPFDTLSSSPTGHCAAKDAHHSLPCQTASLPICSSERPKLVQFLFSHNPEELLDVSPRRQVLFGIFRGGDRARENVAPVLQLSSETTFLLVPFEHVPWSLLQFTSSLSNVLVIMSMQNTSTPNVTPSSHRSRFRAILSSSPMARDITNSVVGGINALARYTLRQTSDPAALPASTSPPVPPVAPSRPPTTVQTVTSDDEEESERRPNEQDTEAAQATAPGTTSVLDTSAPLGGIPEDKSVTEDTSPKSLGSH